MKEYFAQMNEHNQPCVYSKTIGWVATCMSMSMAERIAKELNLAAVHPISPNN